MNRAEPLVSVVIPVFNGERYLAEAIESVLCQSTVPMEIIVVDDGSTDGSYHIAESYGAAVRVVSQANAGTAAARNRGVSLANGRFLAHLDADDLWVEDRLVRQVDAMETHPEVQIVSGLLQQFYSPELDEPARSRIANPLQEMPGHHLGAMLIRREAHDDVGPFETRWKIGQDMDWYLRAIVEKRLGFLMLPHLVMRRRLHGSNKGLSHRRFFAQRMRILKGSLDRRREAAASGGHADAGESPDP